MQALKLPCVMSVKGVSFHQEAVMHAVAGQHLIVRREPENPYDENACRVETGSGDVLGHIAKALAPRLLATGDGPWPAKVDETWTRDVAGLTIKIFNPADEPLEHWIALTGPDHELLDSPPAPQTAEPEPLDPYVPGSAPTDTQLVRARSGRVLGVFVSKEDGRVRVREEDGLEVDYPDDLVICPDMWAGADAAN